ncbi:outer membrane lipoprotein carrier protein LolA [Bacillus sp. HMF5848]|uniref:LolA family protein n=1 Tax=Bacillus sp. HMF5848 TaxID=2495421 RepID=UPI000F79C578|nr:outer membrane lipoprotein carrier protein LolA [Bacillus sp. HMF5848]RSK25663.1 outer membrane lipoprotein carrier protein LolA [Bacillus sp. HMF5848]
MRRTVIGILVSLIVVFGLAACGEKSQEDVKKALEAKVEELTGYKTDATMTIQTGDPAQKYEVEIWHNKPDFYRVSLKNAVKESQQMIIRNEEGVFVLSPALNKSYRFQSDWPHNSSQAYLYESLVKDILDDSEAAFTITENGYVFATTTNYTNKQMLPKQEITLDKKDLSPKIVKVMDPDNNALITVEFENFTFNASFNEGDFDTDKNMTGALLEVPAMANNVEDSAFAVMYPMTMPNGVGLVEEKKFNTENGQRVILTYSGDDKSFSLIQQKAVAAAVATEMSVSGEPVDLGFGVGILSDKSLTWTNDGVEFIIASNNLSQQEMIEIARSVQGQAIK